MLVMCGTGFVAGSLSNELTDLFGVEWRCDCGGVISTYKHDEVKVSVA